jgi:5-methylcytosine-specific restriction protein A
MPWAAPRRCPTPGHPPYTGPRCPLCRQAYDRERRSAARRGYDQAWRELRASFLQQHPMCCVPGCQERAIDVDHIVRIKDGGARLDEHNLQSFCHRHHSVKTRSEQLNTPLIYWPRGRVEKSQSMRVYHHKRALSRKDR